MNPEIASLIAAFDRLAADGFQMGPHWDVIHDLCQANEGDVVFDWGHALCHRIEGDEWNAGYWYRRAGKPVAVGSFEAEWTAMKAEISARS